VLIEHLLNGWLQAKPAIAAKNLNLAVLYGSYVERSEDTTLDKTRVDVALSQP
jgi:hypothetical protein